MSDESRDGLAFLRDYRGRGAHTIVGLMTGTSADAIDAALVRIDGIDLEARHALLGFRETPLDAALRREVLDVAQGETVAPERLMRLDADLGERYAAATLALLNEIGMAPEDVDAIGMHGQTVRHVPRSAGRGALSLQIGSAAVLAERVGLPVVSNFRVRDAAAGGEGAPLVPLFDWWTARSADESRVLLNLGGMANLTYLPRAGGLDDLLAFDTGPGNVLLDALVEIDSGGASRRDNAGAMAARGRVHEALFDELTGDPFFASPPPRSTGRERFGRPLAERLRAQAIASKVGLADLLATAVELTAWSVADAVARFVTPRGGLDAVYASGGGVHNAALMSALSRRLRPVPLRSLALLGIPVDAKEAMAFAFLAHRTLCGLAGNAPGATGASRSVVLGQITPGGIR